MTNPFASKAGWALFERKTFVEIVPIDDSEEHLLGDECWCEPTIEYNEDAQPMIVHNAKDGREKFE